MSYYPPLKDRGGYQQTGIPVVSEYFFNISKAAYPAVIVPDTPRDSQNKLREEFVYEQFCVKNRKAGIIQDNPCSLWLSPL